VSALNHREVGLGEPKPLRGLDLSPSGMLSSPAKILTCHVLPLGESITFIVILEGTSLVMEPSMTSFVKFQAGCSLSLIVAAKAYGEGFDLVQRREAPRSNAIWQADHAQLGILLLREDGKTARPWLTIVIDYSRAIAGYYLGFDPPSSMRTALDARGFTRTLETSAEGNLYLFAARFSNPQPTQLKCSSSFLWLTQAY
jgi:hypothetical protein